LIIKKTFATVSALLGPTLAHREIFLAMKCLIYSWEIKCFQTYQKHEASSNYSFAASSTENDNTFMILQPALDRLPHRFAGKRFSGQFLAIIFQRHTGIRWHRRRQACSLFAVSGDPCGDAVGFSLSKRRRCNGRRQAERAGVTPRIARTFSPADPPSY